MTVGELKAQLLEVPDEMLVVGRVFTHYDLKMNAAVMDQVSISGDLLGQYLVIGNSSGSFGFNYGGGGALYPPVPEGQSQEVLEGLADITTAKHAGQRFKKFTNDYGDFRLFTDWGYPQAGCYGTTYDPRVFYSLRDRGLITLTKEPCKAVPNARITALGLANTGRAASPESERE